MQVAGFMLQTVHSIYNLHMTPKTESWCVCTSFQYAKRVPSQIGITDPSLILRWGRGCTLVETYPVRVIASHSMFFARTTSGLFWDTHPRRIVSILSLRCAALAFFNTVPSEFWEMRKDRLRFAVHVGAPLVASVGMKKKSQIKRGHHESRNLAGS